MVLQLPMHTPLLRRANSKIANGKIYLSSMVQYSLQKHFVSTDQQFYHWLELPEGLNSKDFNERLFKRGAAILCASDCDMARPHSKDPNYVTPYSRFFRFSFGPLLPETFESDIQIFSEVYEEYKLEVLKNK